MPFGKPQRHQIITAHQFRYFLCLEEQWTSKIQDKTAPAFVNVRRSNSKQDNLKSNLFCNLWLCFWRGALDVWTRLQLQVAVLIVWLDQKSKGQCQRHLGLISSEQWCKVTSKVSTSTVSLQPGSPGDHWCHCWVLGFTWHHSG